MNKARLKRIEKAAAVMTGNTTSDIDAQQLLNEITDEELEAIAGPDSHTTPETKKAGAAILAAVIFDGHPELLARCKQRISTNQQNERGS